MNLKRCLKIGAIVIVGLITAKSIADLLKLMNKLKEYQEKSLFTGKDIIYKDEPYISDSVGSVCSGLKLDFSQADMSEEEGFLKLFARNSGIHMVVPNNWKVNLYGLDNKTKIINNTIEPEMPDHILNVDYDFKYCGIHINNPKEDDVFDQEVIDQEDQLEENVIEEVVEEE